MRTTLYLLLACALAGCNGNDFSEDSKSADNVSQQAASHEVKATAPQQPGATLLYTEPAVRYRHEETDTLQKLMDLPKRRTSTIRGGLLWTSPPAIPCPKLPERAGEEFTICSYWWREVERRLGEEEHLVRETTVRLKGKLLAADE
jgi:hypothetical protein